MSFSHSGKKANVQFEKAEETHKPKCCNFTSIFGPSVPLPSRGLGPSKRKGHSKDKTNYACIGMEGPIEGSEQKIQQWLIFLLFFSYKLKYVKRHVCCSQ